MISVEEGTSKRLFSGIQPTGNIHIGNYLGAILPWVNLQARHNSIFCVVDLHAITVSQNPQTLKSKTREVAALLIASGIDPRISILFVQSHISAHAQLAWILCCLIPMGWLQRMTQFKDKARGQQSLASAGLFNYPALMAADILLYETDLVPVGEDQLQHLELTRDVVQRFNSTYGQTFKLPEALIPDAGARIMGLDDPTRKMSKSESLPEHAIYLLDSPDEVRAKIMRATTDSQREIRFDQARPGIHNLLVIYERLTGASRQAIEARFQGKGYMDFKQELAEVVIDSLRRVQCRYREVAAPDYIDPVLRDGASRAMPIAERTLNKVKERIGIR